MDGRCHVANAVCLRKALLLRGVSACMAAIALFRSPESSLQCNMLLGAFDPAEGPFDPDVPAEDRFNATMPCW
jgi:hypothetical protein